MKFYPIEIDDNDRIYEIAEDSLLLLQYNDKYLKYIKVGRFILEERTSTTPFVGSKNQKFVRVHHEEAK